VSEARPSPVLLLAAVFCTNAAAIGQVTVVGKVVYDLTGSKLDLGLLGLAQFAPALVLVLLTGAIADRFDRRRVVAVAAVLQAAITVGLGLYIGSNPSSIGPVFALVFAFGIAQAFSAPAIRSMPADMTDPDNLPRLTAHTAAAGQAGIVAGPVLGGFLYVADVHLPFVAFAALLVIGATAISLATVVGRAEPRPETDATLRAAATVDAAIEPGGHPAAMGAGQGGGWRNALEGLRFVRDDPIILGAISLDLFAVLFGGAVALLPAVAKDRLHVGAVGLGWLQAAVGLGAGTMTMALARWPVGRRLGRLLLSAVAVFGVFTVLLGITRTFAVAFAALWILSAADAVSVYIRATLVPLATPESKRGRVLAVENVFIGASNELGGFESGVAGQLLGTSGSILLGGIATILVAGIWATVFPSLRRVDGFPTAVDA
jgi:predicted MFS family arabinose efflux permease